MNKWEEAQSWEKTWWNDCGNTVWEDVKQMELVPYLGLKIVPNAYTNYRIPLEGQSVLDIGGGPSSLLLKCEDVKGWVVDPCDYPKWVGERYKECGLEYIQMKGEDVDRLISDGENPNDFGVGIWDEVWIYNCLQHTDNPKKIIKNAQKVGKIIRIFEWINTGTNEGHLHSFNKEFFNKHLKGEGKTTKLSSNGLFGEAFYGVFLGDNYDR